MSRFRLGITAGICVVTLLSGLYGLRLVLIPSSNFGGQDQPITSLGEYAWLAGPANDARDGERTEQWRQLANDTCAAQSVRALSRELKTKPTPEAVATGYARYVRDLENTPRDADAASEGCLEGFRA